jgi:hypothetical protein
VEAERFSDGAAVDVLEAPGGGRDGAGSSLGGLRGLEIPQGNLGLDPKQISPREEKCFQPPVWPSLATEGHLTFTPN